MYVMAKEAYSTSDEAVPGSIQYIWRGSSRKHTVHLARQFQEAYSTSDEAVPGSIQYIWRGSSRKHTVHLTRKFQEAYSISGKKVGWGLMFYCDLTNTVDILHFVVPLYIYIYIYSVPVQSKNISFYASHLYDLRLRSYAVWICVVQCTVTIFWGEHTSHSLATQKVKAAGYSTIVLYPDRQ